MLQLGTGLFVLKIGRGLFLRLTILTLCLHLSPEHKGHNHLSVKQRYCSWR